MLQTYTRGIPAVGSSLAVFPAGTALLPTFTRPLALILRLISSQGLPCLLASGLHPFTVTWACLTFLHRRVLITWFETCMHLFDHFHLPINNPASSEKREGPGLCCVLSTDSTVTTERRALGAVRAERAHWAYCGRDARSVRDRGSEALRTEVEGRLRKVERRQQNRRPYVGSGKQLCQQNERWSRAGRTPLPGHRVEEGPGEGPGQ